MSKIYKMLRRLWYPPSTIISSASSNEQAGQMSKQTYFARDEDEDVP
jgi:hypothetical protein